MRYGRTAAWVGVGCTGLAMLPLTAGAQTRGVVELFTSQGCSSCPPADRILGDLARDTSIVAISLPIDYWDYLGWKDTLASPKNSALQKAYAKSRGDREVYTPQAIVDGHSAFVGSDRRSILAALTAAREGVATRIVRNGSQLNVSVGAQPGATTADVLLIGYLREARSHIGRGENSGRTLQEFNIVRSLMRLGTFTGSARDFSVPISSLPHDATNVAVVLQTLGQGVITGAASLPLTAPPATALTSSRAL